LHYFSDLFDKVLYMLRTGPLSIVRMLHPQKKRRWLDLSQILSGQGLDPTSLLKSEEVVLAMQCNFQGTSIDSLY